MLKEKKKKEFDFLPRDLNREEAAHYLGISVQHLDRIKCQTLDTTSNRKLRYIREGKRILFPLEELERYRIDRNSRQWQ